MSERYTIHVNLIKIDTKYVLIQSKIYFIFYAPMCYGHMGRVTTMCDQYSR